MSETLTLEEAPEGGDFEIIPEDSILEAEVAKVEVVTTKMTDENTGEPVKRVEFTFLIQEEPYLSQKRRLWGSTSTKFNQHENCKLRAWVQEIMAVDQLTTGFKLDLQALVGNRCRVVVEERSWESKTKTNEDGTPFIERRNGVKEVFRSRSATRTEEPF